MARGPSAAQAAQIPDRPGFDARPPQDVHVDFFCIGTPKSRSTWLARVIDEHPAIAVSIPKETNFFARHWTLFVDQTPQRFLCGWDWYRACFNQARPGQLRGDFSVNLYRNAPEAADLVRGAFPDARLLAVLRDPVRRLYSHYWHRFNNPTPPRLTRPPEEALLEDVFLDTSRYHRHLRRWADRFGDDRLHLVFDFELAQDAPAAVAECFRFLGVDDRFRPPSLQNVIFPTSRPGRLWPLASRTAAALRRAGAGRLVDGLNRAGLKERLFQAKGAPSRYPPLDAGLAARLYERLVDDIDALEAWSSRDLTPWRWPAASG